VVHRHQLRSTIAELCRLLTRAPARQPVGTMPVSADQPASAAAAPAPTPAAPPATA
jgi:acetyl-CoA carboxylase carboxyl transferase subunit beta